MESNNTTHSENETFLAIEQSLAKAEAGFQHRLVYAEYRYRLAERRSRVLGCVAFAALLGAVLLVPGSHAAIAQTNGGTLEQLATELAKAQADISILQNRLSADETTIAGLKSRATTDESNISGIQTHQQTDESNITSLTGRASTLEQKTQFITASATGKWTAVIGCNMYVQNGLGATNGNPDDGLNPQAAVTNGLGNLIIGYNEEGSGSGSHNLILGDLNRYSSYGGIVGGFDNSITGAYASVTGGAQNTADGQMSTILGGLSNESHGVQSCISGGGQNVASGDVSSIYGGVNNIASGYVSTAGGGVGINENITFGWSGGSYHSP